MDPVCTKPDCCIARHLARYRQWHFVNGFMFIVQIADDLHLFKGSGGDYNLDHKGKQATLTETGLSTVYNKLGQLRLYIPKTLT